MGDIAGEALLEPAPIVAQRCVREELPHLLQRGICLPVLQTDLELRQHCGHAKGGARSEEYTSELQSPPSLHDALPISLTFVTSKRHTARASNSWATSRVKLSWSLRQ